MAPSYVSPNAVGGGGGYGFSANENSCAHGAQINNEDLTPYLTYDSKESIPPACLIGWPGTTNRDGIPACQVT